MSILAKIAAHKREEVQEAKKRKTEAALLAELPKAPPYSLLQALQKKAADGFAVIAEIKKASPSKGVIRADFDPEAIARSYRAHGAAAISVLTDRRFFQGAPEFVAAARRGAGALPILRKDFLLDPYQVVEARAIGADAVLIIMALVEDALAEELLAAARELGMDALVEVHEERELERALVLGARLIGINNRDLKTFSVSLATTERLAPLAHEAGAFVVAESGLFAHEDLVRLRERTGVRAFLIGEGLMRAPDPGKQLAAILGGEGR